MVAAGYRLRLLPKPLIPLIEGAPGLRYGVSGHANSHAEHSACRVRRDLRTTGTRTFGNRQLACLHECVERGSRCPRSSRNAEVSQSRGAHAPLCLSSRRKRVEQAPDLSRLRGSEGGALRLRHSWHATGGAWSPPGLESLVSNAGQTNLDGRAVSRAALAGRAQVRNRINLRIAGLAIKSQDGAVGLITRRSRVRIPPPLLPERPAIAGLSRFWPQPDALVRRLNVVLFV